MLKMMGERGASKKKKKIVKNKGGISILTEKRDGLKYCLSVWALMDAHEK